MGVSITKKQSSKQLNQRNNSNKTKQSNKRNKK